MTNDGAPEIFPLAAEFPAGSREDWLKLVSAALKGAPFEKLTSRTYDELRIEPLYARDPNAARLAEALADETAGVAAALKIMLPFVNPWQYVMEVVALGADAKSSMALDLATGHPTEVDHINGAVVAFGRRTATPTPYNDAMVRLIKAREAVLARSRLRLHT